MKTLFVSFLILSGISLVRADTNRNAEVLIYGGTSGGVMAAVQAHREGRSVIIVSPDKHLGGLSSSGLGWADVGNVSLIGGLSREFFHLVWLHYHDSSAWSDGVVPKAVRAQTATGRDDIHQLMYVFEPKVAEGIFNELVSSNKIPVVHGRLDSKNSVLKEGKRIIGIRLEGGQLVNAKVFIDASYEGDLMAGAGVSYTVGREASSQYGEDLDGLQVRRATKNQLPIGIDPYIKKGDAGSGLLPGVNPPTTEPDGAGDRRIQAYCYRMCLTSDPAHQVAISRPDGYREEDYELLFRAIEAGAKGPFFKLDPIPNHKTDSNNAGGISTDYIGMNYDYPEADYAGRERIAQAHRDWQLGLIWTLQHSPRIAPAMRTYYSRWGLPDDEFADNGHWPYDLYIRESRRMVGDYVLTEGVLAHGMAVERPVGIGSYAMDSHNAQRLVGMDGMVHNEGDVQKPVKQPYQIDYGVLLPKRTECNNLLVPFCISATHIAFGSVRMEPVFMILSQSAASAADIALEDHVAVQDVPYEQLKARLAAGGQKLERDSVGAPELR